MTSPEVTIAQGHLRGCSVDKDIDVFKGIRYAEAPYGPLRWQPPQPIRPSCHTFEATEFGPCCPQQVLPFDTAPKVMDEDCLRLNIWRPAGCSQSDALPVMVWIHGGGFVNGSACAARYDGSSFARSGVIFVSIHYRLGRLGFFAHPALEDDPLRGNYGLMDQIEALRWIKENIAAFGGDKHNITVFGESAGGMSIISLLTSRITHGLFNKAIIQSGGGRHNLVPGNDWATAVEQTYALAHMMNIPAGKSRASLEALRAVPAHQLVKGLDMGNLHERPGYCAPMIDGVIIEDEPQTLFQQGAYHRIPIIIGTTDADLGFAAIAKTLDDALALFQPNSESDQRARAIFAHQPPQRIAQQLATDQLMTEPARFVAQKAYHHHSDAWLYRFGYVPETLADGVTGSPHGGEIEFVFNTLGSLHCPVSARDREVAELIHRYWVAFAQEGRPQAQGLPEWAPYNPNDDNVLWISPLGARHSSILKPDPWHERLDLVAKLAGDS